MQFKILVHHWKSDGSLPGCQRWRESIQFRR